ncbi:restriction endonuclease subunit S [uncultured Alistipes sp.]|uniref:restriction endonuclease subunit S n=1 Tax=uncultured Alistipes sp. TaxID=538949 RepID=UPI002635AC9F|nr:restriction endonuclease subunit S [uncultured Alistipes sp.]
MDTKKLRQKILDLAIRGKLVPQDPNDEPASVLLERIQAEKEQLIKNGKIKRSKKSASSDTYPYENVPFEIPENWVWTTIGEVFNLQAGRFVEASQIYSDSTTIHPYPCFGGNGLRGYVSDYNREGIFPIIGRQGALCGNINLASSKFYATEHAIVVETFCNMNCYWSSYVLKFLNLNQYATATAQPGLSVKTVNEVCIPIPPLSEQARIVNAIGDWFAIIDKIEQEQVDLTCAIKQTKSKILDIAIHGKLVPQDPNDEPAIELLRRINPSFKPCDNAHYKNLPKSWDVIHLGDICQLADGEVISITELPYLDVKSLRNQTYTTKGSGKFIKAGTTLILVDGENSGEVFHATVDGYQGSTMKILNINSNINQMYVLNFIKLYQKALRENKVGSAIPHLNKKMFRELMIPIPPIAEQNRIVKEVDRYNVVIDSIIAEL